MLTHAQIVALDDAAHEGGLLLDEKGPEGWAHRVDPDTLRMKNTSLCVLGQAMAGPCWGFFVRSSYAAKLRRLGITPEEQVRYGFALWAGQASAEMWDALADAWREEILVRTETPTMPGLDDEEQRSLVLV